MQPVEGLLPWSEQDNDALAKMLRQRDAFALVRQPVSVAAWIAAGIHARFDRTVICVTDGPRTLDEFHGDLATLTRRNGLTPLYYPAWESLPGHGAPPSPDLVGDRLATLQALIRRERPLLVVTCIQALMQRTPAIGDLKRDDRTIRTGDTIPLDELLTTLQGLGYDPQTEVLVKGQMALRGGVIDLWPPTSDWPVRLELFGDMIESMRTFDPAEQRSRDPLTELALHRAVEAQDGLTGTFLDTVPTDAVWLLHDAESIDHHADTYEQSIRDANAGHVAVALDALRERLGSWTRLRFTLTDDASVHRVAIHPLEGLPAVSGDTFRPDLLESERQRFVDGLRDKLADGWTVRFFFGTEGGRSRFAETYGRTLASSDRFSMDVGVLSEGFVAPDSKLIVVAEPDFYGHRKQQRSRYDPLAKRPGGTKSEIERIADWTDIQPGDYVVHVDHGIGKYLGLYQIEMNGTTQEVLTVEYASKAKLYIPVAQAHLLSKYVGLGKRRPELHTLGTKRWEKEKDAAKRAVEDFASLLLDTQAKRDALPGHAFSPDSPWQHEFEASFPYKETPDQDRAITDVKRDMENTRPMDRLVCGDVGYGKTEVAMRAAFKAVMDGKQVAMLVPTTILAQQHYDGFSERMAAYPVRIEMLSRFQTRGEQNSILARLAEGSVDIVIGTHRLVQKDVLFKDLGLVIIDEEQRFGVKHKEHFKRMRHLVDVLTLTATPIPRTLYMSLTGARDLSTIQTPPVERMPIETLVVENTDEVVREAVMREINREGQVYFLHNRVQSIDRVYERLRRLVPEARIEIGHGQMDEHQLAMIMRAFVRGDFDILLCTTIIESGLDIPNVNTILIDRADRFGLAELYQLRGRVGRFKRKAYAYLLLPKHAALFDNARKRIGAIRKYSHLGAGFKLALRDLEIRGAGNLLGAEQSGHITSVGFDLYCQLLKRTVARMKGESLPPVIDVDVRLDFVDLTPGTGDDDDSAAIPAGYAEDESQRIGLYRKLAGAASNKDLDAVRDEIRDRYGKIPGSLERLLLIARLRVAAAAKRVSRIEVEDGKVMITRRGDLITLPDGKFPRLVSSAPSDRLEELMKWVKAL